MRLDAAQTFENSASYLYPNGSTNHPPSAENTVENSLTHESNNFRHTQPSQIETNRLD
jgi:hypothetical protein